MHARPIAASAALLGLGLTLLAHDASAAIIPVLQARSVAANAVAAAGDVTDNQGDSASAADFAPFVANVNPVAVAEDGLEFAFAEGVGDQGSSLGANFVSARGEAALTLMLLAGERGNAAAGAESSFVFEFALGQASIFGLSGLLDTQAVVSGGAAIPALLNEVLFENLTDAYVLFQTLTNDEAFAVGGVLQPGSYRLSASARADASQGSSAVTVRTVSAFSRFDIAMRVDPLSVPEPGVLALLCLGLAAVRLVPGVRFVRLVPGVRFATLAGNRTTGSG